MSLLLGLLGLEPFQKFVVGGGGRFHFGPNLGLRLEAGTKLNNSGNLSSSL